jgi:hypothetical protein
MLNAMPLHFPSPLADAVDEQYRVEAEWLAAFRSGDLKKSKRLLVELERANQRRRELTPPRPLDGPL